MFLFLAAQLPALGVWGWHASRDEPLTSVVVMVSVYILTAVFGVGFALIDHRALVSKNPADMGRAVAILIVGQSIIGVLATINGTFLGSGDKAIPASAFAAALIASSSALLGLVMAIVGLGVWWKHVSKSP